MNTERIAIMASEIHPPFIEGVQKTTWILIQEFLRQQKEVVVFTQQSFGVKEIPKSALLQINYWFTVSKTKLYKYFAWIGNGKRIMRELRRQHIKQLYVFSLDLPFFFVLVWIFLCASDIQVVLTIFSPRETTFLGKVFLKVFKHRFFHYMVRSEYSKKRLLLCGVLPEKITVLLLFPNKQLFVASSIADVRKRPYTIAYLSNAEATAGVHDMLALAKLLPEYKFTIAIRKFSEEEETKVKEIEQKIVNDNLPNVFLERTISDMTTFLREIETVILPVTDENASMDMPMVMIEALASKAFVVVRSLPLFEQLAQQKYVVSFNTLDQLKKLVELPALTKKEYSEQGYAWVMHLPNVSEASEIYNDVFKD